MRQLIRQPFLMLKKYFVLSLLLSSIACTAQEADLQDGEFGIRQSTAGDTGVSAILSYLGSRKGIRWIEIRIANSTNASIFFDRAILDRDEYISVSNARMMPGLMIDWDYTISPDNVIEIKPENELFLYRSFSVKKSNNGHILELRGKNYSFSASDLIKLKCIFSNDLGEEEKYLKKTGVAIIGKIETNSIDIIP